MVCLLTTLTSSLPPPPTPHPLNHTAQCVAKFFCLGRRVAGLSGAHAESNTTCKTGTKRLKISNELGSTATTTAPTTVRPLPTGAWYILAALGPEVLPVDRCCHYFKPDFGDGGHYPPTGFS